MQRIAGAPAELPYPLLILIKAFEYAGGDMLRESYDYAFVDTWRDASDGAPMFLRMKALEHLHPRTEFSYWIEGFIRSRIRAYKYAKLKENPDTGSGFYEKSYDGLINYLTDFSDVTPEEMEL